jgi:hypothetical protein
MEVSNNESENSSGSSEYSLENGEASSQYSIENEGEKNNNVANNAATKSSNYSLEESEENTIENGESRTLDDEADLEESTGPEVAAGAGAESDEEATLYIGDIIQITTAKSTVIKGMVYYLSPRLIRVMPEGTSNQLIDIPLPDEGEEDTFGIVDLAYNKGPRISFVALLALRSGLTVHAYKADGTYLRDYVVEEVNEEADSARLTDETGASISVDFDYGGIPSDLDFDVLVVKSYEAQGEVARNLDASAVNEEAESSADAEAGEEEDDSASADRRILKRVSLAEIVGLKAPEIRRITQARSSEVIYPEILQKNDFLSNLVSILEPEQRANNQILKKLRAMVEMASIMKNQLVKRSYDGTIEGDAVISARTLDDVLNTGRSPLAFPVIDADRSIAISKEMHVEEPYGQSGAVRRVPVMLDNFEDFIPGVSLTTESRISGKFARDEDAEADYNSIQVDRNGDYPRFYQYLNKLIAERPPGFVFNVGQGKTYEFAADKDFYRGVPGETVFGIKASQETSFKFPPKAQQIKDDITYSIGRGLGPTYRKPNPTTTILTIAGNRATHKGTVLYPLQTAAELGATRSGKLFVDIARSHGSKVLVTRIINDLDGVEYVGRDNDSVNIQKVLYFDAANSRTAQMSFNDFLEISLKTITPRGPGDLTTYENDYGIGDYEYTEEQAGIIEERVRAVIGAIRNRVIELRAVKPAVSSIVSMVLPSSNFVGRLREATAIYAPLADAMKAHEAMMPNYAESDLALTAHMLKFAQEYFYAVMSGNGTAVDRETMRYHRDNLIAVRDAIFRIKKLQAEKGSVPTENPCQHVKEFAAIERVADDADRMGLMVKFRNTYLGEREGDWFNCVVCKKHLMCHHTYLQIQQFLHKKEQLSIQKELILTYAGRVYGGSYICGNCGVPIRSLDFDTNLEFDDEGRPLMGRGIIEDTEEDEDKNLKLLLGIDDKIKEDQLHKTLNLQNAKKKDVYNIVKQITSKLGILFTENSYMKVINNSLAYLDRLKDEATYNAEQKAQKKTGSSITPYTIYLNRTKVLIIAAQIIIEIQTAIPDYLPLYTEPGCRVGFDGYPLQAVENPTADNVGNMIHYMVCCLHPLVFKNIAPWPQTAWAAIGREKERRENMTAALITVIRGVASTDYVQKRIEAKKAYLEKIFGRKTLGERPSEVIPEHYMPVMMFEDEEKKVAAEEPVVVAVTAANGKKNYNVRAAGLMAQAWLNAAHAQARETVNKGFSLRAETGSCYGPITSPQDYIKTHEDSYPQKPPRLVPTEPHQHHSIIGVPFVYAPPTDEQVSLDNKYVWQVFLKLCYQGERVGEPHEYSINHVCDWCGMKAPTEYLYPDVDKYGAPLVDEATVKSFIQTQGIDMSDESFYKLLNAANNRLTYTPYSAPQTAKDEMLTVLPALQPAPFAPIALGEEGAEKTWSDYITAAIEISKKEDVRTELAFVSRIEEFSSLVDSLEGELREQYVVNMPRGYDGFTIDGIFKAYDKILDDRRAFELVRNYYLLPIQRVVNDNWEGLDKIMAHRKDSGSLFKSGNEAVASKPVFEQLQSKVAWKSRINVEDIPRDILQDYAYKLSAYLKHSAELVAARIPHSGAFLPLVRRALFYGPLLDLLGSADSDDMRINILRMFNSLTRVYANENRAYDINVIREIKQKMVENEKQTFISKIDKLTPEQRALEMQLKAMKLKSHLTGIDYSIGGTTTVYQYDPSADYWKNMNSIDAAYQADGIAYEATGEGEGGEDGYDVGDYEGEYMD